MHQQPLARRSQVDGQMAAQQDAPEIVADVWEQLLRNNIGLNAHGCYTVTSLARCAKLRLVCVNLREANKHIETPYDARVVYSDDLKVVPIRFSGGMHFGSVYADLAALSIIRDRDNGQMFAVTSHYAGVEGGVHWSEVVRTYTLYRLAELLNGHSPDWAFRLPDIHELAYRNTGTNLYGFRVKHATLFESGTNQCIVTKNQLVAKEYMGTPAAGVRKHHDDCISSRILEWRRPMPPPPPWGGNVARPAPEHYKQPNFMLLTSKDGAPVSLRSLDWQYARVGAIGTVMKRYDFNRPMVAVPSPDEDADIAEMDYADRVHCLSMALGWHCAPEIVKELAGLASLLSHGKAALPTAFDSLQLHYHVGQPQRWPAVTLKLEEMAEAARALRDKEVAERTRLQAQMEKLVPGANKKRERRGAAAAAERALAAASMGSVNVDGSIDPKKFKLQCSRSDRAAQTDANPEALLVQEEAGGSDNWYYEQQARRDTEWEPPKRSRPSTPKPKPKPAAPGGSCSFIDLINSM